MTKRFLKFQPEHTIKKAFLVPNIRISNPSQNFAITQIRVPLLQIWQYHFQILAQKYSNRHFWSQI